jgi:hypothetical protein
VGVTWNCTKPNVLTSHYENKAQRARQVANVTLGLKTMVGHIPPWEGRKLYMACVDPHLNFGCEVAIDVDLRALELLESVQADYLSHLLSLGPHITQAFLFIKTGVVPIRFRRLTLALRYLRHVLDLSLSHLVHCAWHEARVLALAGQPGWLSDLDLAIQHLPGHPRACPSATSASREDIDLIITAVDDTLKRWLQGVIATAAKGEILCLRHAAEHSPSPLKFRAYLNIRVPEHRKAMTHLMVGDHRLAIERLRWRERGREPTPRKMRLCRLCGREVEEPVHVLMQCMARQELVDLCSQFMAVMLANNALLSCMVGDDRRLGHLLATEKVCEQVAKFVYEVFAIFDSELLPVWRHL